MTDWRARREERPLPHAELKNPGGRVLALVAPPTSHIREDYGVLLRPCADGRGTTTRSVVDFAGPVADDLIRLFADPADGGGLRRLGHDAERLVVRQKDVFDNAMLVGQLTRRERLLRFAAVTGDRRYERTGARVPTMLCRCGRRRTRPVVYTSRNVLSDLIDPAHSKSPDRSSRDDPWKPQHLATRCRTGFSRNFSAADRNWARARPPAARRARSTPPVCPRRDVCEDYTCRRPVTATCAPRPSNRRRARRPSASRYVDVSAGERLPRRVG